MPLKFSFKKYNSFISFGKYLGVSGTNCWVFVLLSQSLGNLKTLLALQTCTAYLYASSHVTGLRQKMPVLFRC